MIWGDDLAATGATAAGRAFLGLRKADLFGKAVGVLCLQGKNERVLMRSSRFNRELGDESVLIFDLRIQIIAAENGGRPLDDVGQFSRGEAVISIVRHPGLEAER